MKNPFRKLWELFLKIKKKYPLQTEIALYAAVSLLAKIVDMAVMALVRFCCEPELYHNFADLILMPGSDFANMLGTAFGFAVGTLVEYLVSTYAVFERNTRGQTPVGFAVFIVISVGGLGIHLVGQLIGGELGINPYITKLIMGFFAMAYNYVVKKIVLYTKTKWGRKEKGKGNPPDSLPPAEVNQ